MVQYAFGKRPSAFRRVRAVACLATPFFAFSIRPGYESLVTSAIAGLLVVLFETLFYSALIIGKKFYRGIVDETLPIVLIGSVLLLLAGAVHAHRARKFFYASFASTFERVRQWDTTTVTVPGLRLFRSIGDEVALGLTTAQFTSTIVSATLNVMARLTSSLVSRLSKWSRSSRGKVGIVVVGGSVIVIASLPAAFGLTFGENPKYWLDLLWGWNRSFDCFVCSSTALDQLARVIYQLVVVLVILTLASALIFVIVLLTAWIISALVLRSFGAWSLRASLVTQFAVEPTPEGSHKFVNGRAVARCSRTQSGQDDPAA